MTFMPPVTDIEIALDALGHSELVARSYPEIDQDLIRAVLEGAGAFAAKTLAPLNRVGDRSGARCGEEGVRASTGFAEAYREFVEQGWNTLSADPRHGGQGLTKTLALAVFEMLHAANMAFALCPMLTQGAIEALSLHGTERQQRIALPRLVSGEWTGTMNLTESQAGSDLAGLTTRATPQSDGSYRLSGEKIFITWGDHDIAENVCHLVLARTPDAPSGVRGISLFLATKYDVDSEGATGARNNVRAASIEHKLGIHGSPTCVMIFEEARAELVGELGRGLAHMFAMMNAARQQVAVQGVGVAERAFQQALVFSKERRQGRSLWSSESPAPIFDHPDVRRMLGVMKAKIEAARGICLLTAIAEDLAQVGEGEEERAKARRRAELLTPIAKAWSTDVGVEVASLGVQVHGGMGFIEETGAAQHYRDARIAPIYEGTNGIQAIDLVARKLTADNGASMLAVCKEVRQASEDLRTLGGLHQAASLLWKGADALERATHWILINPGTPALAAADSYLSLSGDVIGGYVHARQVLRGAALAAAWTERKASLLHLYATHILCHADALALTVEAGEAELRELAL